jgi:hypothetical protein
MNLFRYLLAGVVSICPVIVEGTESAKATLYCYSLRFQRGIDPQGNYYLDLSSVNGANNGELALDFLNSGYTHSAYLNLVDELFGENSGGMMAINVPDGGDANKDGFPDFFQVSQSVTNLISAGAYHLNSYGDGSLTATWNRSVGSKDGACVFSMKLLPFQPVTFSVGFEILEYKGPLSYTPTTTNVSGRLNLVQTGNSGSSMNGALEFTKATTDRFNQLTLQAGIWTNESQQTLSYTNHLFSRDVGWPTNYYGYVEFDNDGNPDTLYPYALWMLAIDDANDSNHNGIPDFSDDPVSGTLPRRPQLDLLENRTNLVIRLHGDVGHLHEVQQLAEISSGNWQTTASVTLTNDPQTLAIPLPAGPMSFWRVRAR